MGDWFWDVDGIQSIRLLSICCALGTQWGMRSPFFRLTNVIENCILIMAGTLGLTHQVRSKDPSSVTGSLVRFQRPGQPGSPMSPAPWSLLRAIHTKAQTWKPRGHGIQPLSCPEAGLHLLSKRTSSLCLHASRDEMLSISTRKNASI